MGIKKLLCRKLTTSELSAKKRIVAESCIQLRYLLANQKTVPQDIFRLLKFFDWKSDEIPLFNNLSLGSFVVECDFPFSGPKLISSHSPDVLIRKKTLLILTPLGSLSSTWVDFFPIAAAFHEKGDMNILFLEIEDARMNVNRWAECVGAVLPILITRMNIGQLQVLGFGSGAGAWFMSQVSSNIVFQTGINVLVDPEMPTFDGDEPDCAIICGWSKKGSSSRKSFQIYENVKHFEVGEEDDLSRYISCYSKSQSFVKATDTWVNCILGHLESPVFDWVTIKNLIHFIDRNKQKPHSRESRENRIKNLISRVM